VQKTRAQILELFARQVAAWAERFPAEAGVIRERVCGALKFTAEEYRAWVKAAGIKDDGSRAGEGDGSEATRQPLTPRSTSPHVALSPEGERGTATAAEGPRTDDQGDTPRPLGRPVAGEGRPSVSNFSWVQKTAADGKKENNAVAFDDVLPVRIQAQRALGGWPLRIGPPGVKSGMLFADAGGGTAVMVEDPTEFQHLLQTYATIKFNKGQDKQRVNYVSMETLYTDFCSSTEIKSFAVVETSPHEPPIRGHYYVHRPERPQIPAGKGSYLQGLMGFFTNITEPAHRALAIAAIVTPFWGGPYGQRPAFVLTADHPGSGKTTFASMIGGLTSVDGALSINLDKHSEERVKERMLSGEGRRKRVGTVDNVKGVAGSGMLEELVTSEWISGKQLFYGEASRPNTFTFFITSNNARLSTDMARRSFYIDFKKPDANPSWKESLIAFLERWREGIIDDCLWLLSQPKPAMDWTGNKGETFSMWCECVLARVWACPALVGGSSAAGEVAAAQRGVEGLSTITPAEVVRLNQKLRDDSDESRDEAQVFFSELLRLVCAWKGYEADAASSNLPKKEIFIPTTAPATGVVESTDEGGKRILSMQNDKIGQANNMLAYWERIFGREVNAKWLANTLDDHIAAGRIAGLWRGRTRDGRGYYLSHEVIGKFVRDGCDACDGSSEAANDSATASPVAG
jgi:hypothetical protein